MKGLLPIALGISVAVHIGVIFGVQINRMSLAEKKLDEKDTIIQELQIIARKSEITNSASDLKGDQDVLPYISKQNFKKVMSADDKLPKIVKSNLIEEGLKEIILSEIPNDTRLRENPAYMDYYRMVRRRIKSTAYNLYGVDLEGEVIISFVVNAAGKLMTLFVGQGSKDNTKLQSIALKSVRQAAPFAPFPDELLKYTRLQFNISIYFKSK